MNDVLITICARGGSKGLPNKNILKLNGIPLLAYSVKMQIFFQVKIEIQT